MADIEIPPTPSVPGKKIADPDTKKNRDFYGFFKGKPLKSLFHSSFRSSKLVLISKP
jgi:hypothetical protein